MLTKILAAALLITSAFSTVKDDGTEIIRKMHRRYSYRWHKGLSFEQTTEQFRNDSLIRTQTWHELIAYPDKLRVDIAPLSDHNGFIVRGDSTYLIRNGQVRNARPQGNDLIFLLGGMYYIPLDTVFLTLKKQGYDLSKAYEDSWQGQPVYVIGAKGKGENVNQLWIDQKNLYLVRMIKYNPNEIEEGVFENQTKLGNGWSETKASFYFNGKLIQRETYHNTKAHDQVDTRFFNPNAWMPLPLRIKPHSYCIKTVHPPGCSKF